MEDDSGKYSCTYKGQTRRFILCLPEQQPERPYELPLVVLLHGHGANARAFRSQTQFEKEALPRGYAVLYLSGIPNPSFPMSSPGWNYTYRQEGKDDIAFITQITRYIQRTYKLKKKAFAVGFSAGAFMACKLAVEEPDLFPAVASVAGMMPDTIWNRRRHRSPCRLLQINGTKDPVVPMKAYGTDAYNPHPAMEDVIAYFVQTDGASQSPEEESISENTKILKYGDAVWWTITENATHTWPSPQFCGYNVNSLILDFFDKAE